MAFWVRSFPIFYNYPILKAFDPWVQYSATQYIVEQGPLAFFTYIDYRRWYPYGYLIYKLYPGLPFTAAGAYFLFNIFGIQIGVYETVIIFPAIMGAISVFAIYFLGKIIHNKKTGLLAALFLAILPAYVQRTVAGFFDNETIGIFLIIIILYFFIYSIKEDSTPAAFISGLGVGGLMCSWGAWAFIVDLLPLTVAILILIKKYSTRLLVTYTITIGVGVFIGSRFPSEGPSVLATFEVVAATGMIAVLFLFEIYNRLKEAPWIKRRTIPWKKIIFFSIIIILLLVIGFFSLLSVFNMTIDDFLELFGIASIPDKLISVLNPLASNFIIQSVGEHLPSPWGVYYYNLHILILLMPIGFYFLFRRLREEDVLLILFGITSVYFAGSFIRLLLILAPAAAIIGGFGITSLIGPYSVVFQKKFITSRRRQRFAKIISREASVGIVVVVTGISFLTVMHGLYTAAYQLSSSVMIPGGLDPTSKFHDWEQTWSWMHASLGTDAVVTSWWDYGYWITSAGGATSSADNGTFNSTQIAMIGRLMMSTNEMDAIDICKRLGTTHLLVYWGYYTGLGGDEGKWVWMVKIGFEHPDLNPITYTYEIEDYYNESTGQPNTPFFNSLIFKMLTANDFYYTHDYADQDSSLQQHALYYRFIDQMHRGTDASGIPYWQSLETPERLGTPLGSNPFANIGPVVPGEACYILQDPEYFPLAFMSTNQYGTHLVKVYSVDYVKAGLRLDITNVSLYNSGISTLTVKNTGDRNCSLDTLKIGGSTYDFDPINGTGTLSPNDSVIVRGYGNPFSEGAMPEVNFEVHDPQIPSNLFTAINDSVVTVMPALNYSFSIDESNSYLYSNDTIMIDIENNGTDYVKIDHIQLERNNVTHTFTNNGTEYDFYFADSYDVNWTGDTRAIINVSESGKIIVPSNILASKSLDLVPGDIYNVTVKARNEDLIWSFNKMAVANGSCLTLYDPLVYANESVFFTVNNTGLSDLHVQKLYINTPYFNYYATPNPGESGLLLAPGEGQYFEIHFSSARDELDLNMTETARINVVADHALHEDSNMPYYQAIENAPGYSINVTDEAYSNETMIINVNNTGLYQVELSNFWVDNHLISNVQPQGGNFILAPGVDRNFTAIVSNYNYNYSDQVTIKVRTYEGPENTTSAFANATGSLEIINSVVYRNGSALINMNNTGTNTLLLKDFNINGQTITDFTPVDYFLSPSQNQTYNLTITSPPVPGTTLTCNVSTYEGAYVVDDIQWSISINITQLHAYDDGNATIQIENNGILELSISEILLTNTTGGEENVTTTIDYIGGVGKDLQPGDYTLLNVTSTFLNNAFSELFDFNITVNYSVPQETLSFIVEDVFTLAQSINYSFITGYPYSLAYDNSTFNVTMRDTVYVTIRNTGAVNISVNQTFSLNFNNSVTDSPLNFTAVDGNDNLILQPYESRQYINQTLNDVGVELIFDLASINYLEVNATVNSTSTFLTESLNLTVLANEYNITFFEVSSDVGDHDMNITIANLGNHTLTINDIKYNDTQFGTYETIRQLNPNVIDYAILPGEVLSLTGQINWASTGEVIHIVLEISFGIQENYYEVATD